MVDRNDHSIAVVGKIAVLRHTVNNSAQEGVDRCLKFFRQNSFGGGFFVSRGSTEEKFAQHFGNIQYKTEQGVPEQVLYCRSFLNLPICIVFIHFRTEHQGKQQIQDTRTTVFIDDNERRRSAIQRLRVISFDGILLILLLNEVDLSHARKFFERDFARNFHNGIPKRFHDAVYERRKQCSAVQPLHDRIDISGAVAVIVARQMRLIHIVDELNERFVLFRCFPFIHDDIEYIADRLFHRGIHCRALRDEAVKFVQKERKRFFEPLYRNRCAACHVHINIAVGIFPESRFRGDCFVGGFFREGRYERVDQIVHRAAHAEHGKETFKRRLDAARLYRIEKSVDQTRAEICNYVFRKPELRLLRVFGEIIDRAFRLIRLYVGNVVEVFEGIDIRFDRALLTDVFAREGYKAHRAGIGDRRTRFDVVQLIARFRRHGRDVVRVHVTRENIMDTRIRKRRRNILIIVDEVIAEELFLHVKMLDETVMHHANDGIALRLCRLRLLDNPIFQLFADLTARLMFRRTRVGIVRAVTTAVDDDDRVPFRRLCDVGEHTRLVAVFRFRISGRLELRDDAVLRVVDGIGIRFEEQFGRSARSGNFDAVLRVIIIREAVVHVVVAVRDVNFDVGELLFKLRELLRYIFMRFQLAVLREIARDHEHVGRLFGNFGEHPVQNSRAFGENFAVAVERVLIVRRVLDEVGRKDVDVGQHCDVQGLFVRRRLRLLFLRDCIQPARQKSDHKDDREKDGKQRNECVPYFACHILLQNIL